MRSQVLLFLVGTFPFLLLSVCDAQQIGGIWEGFVLQEGSPDTFFYRLEVDQQGEGLSGTSVTWNRERTQEARFAVSGVVESDGILLQEMDQLAPEGAQWCRKFARLRFRKEGGVLVLSGGWEAEGCRPGKLVLFAKNTTATPHDMEQARLGKWVGYLSQSDRDYGFYFEMIFEESGLGSSYIVSEGGGGWARHSLRWEWDEVNGQMDVREMKVIERGQEGWPWCIKQSELQFSLAGDKMTLEGDWAGQIENTSSDKGRCAAGKILVERILPAPPEPSADPAEHPVDKEPDPAYSALTGRPVEVQRTVNVRSREIQLKMWDNGVMDGDILTIYLNGKLLLSKHRLRKDKSVLSIQLESEDNTLVLHADDLGDLPPNTVAVTIDDGEEEQLLMLTSNLKKSGAVLIRRFTVRED